MTSGLLLHPPAVPPPAPARLRVIVSSLPSDSHTWNLVYVELVIRELGHEVHNLGACVPVGTLRRECRRAAADLVVISTVNGHGFSEGLRAVRGLRRSARLRRVPVVIGGKLTTDGRPGSDVSQQLVDAGFTEVFLDDDVERFRSFVSSLAARARR